MTNTAELECAIAKSRKSKKILLLHSLCLKQDYGRKSQIKRSLRQERLNCYKIF